MQETKHDDAKALYSGRQAVVVGAGPCGSLAAVYLAQQGFTVNVYERSEAHAPGTVHMAVGPRSYNILLSRRAMAAIEGAGLKLPEGRYVHCEGAVRYRPKAKKIGSVKMNEWSNAINRGALAGHLVAEAQRLHPGSITFHFGAELQQLSLADRSASFSSSDGQQQQVSYDLLLGADGASSRVREAFAQQLPGFSYSQVRDDMEYKTLELPSLQHKDPDYRSHFLSMFDQARNASIIGSPDPDGKLRAVFILERGQHDELQTVEAYVAALKASFPHFLEDQYEFMAQQLVGSPVSSGGLNSRCSTLAGPSAMLLGDAGHSMWPSLGQGANAALEDCSVLAQVLRQAQGDPAAVPQLYSSARHADALAAVDLTEAGFGGKNVRSFGLNYPMLKVVGLLLLHKALPAVVPRPAFMMINDTLSSYSSIKQRSEAQSRAIDLTLVGAAAVAAAFAIRPAAAIAARVLGG